MSDRLLENVHKIFKDNSAFRSKVALNEKKIF